VRYPPGGGSTRVLWVGSFWRLTIIIVKHAAPSKSSAATAPPPSNETLVDEGGQRRPIVSQPTGPAPPRGSTYH